MMAGHETKGVTAMAELGNEPGSEEQFLFKTFDAREAYLRQMGDVDEMLLAPLVNPGLVGGPRWPSLRESWRTVRKPGRTIVVSDGLSDPFEEDGEPNVGYGIEVLGETSDEVSGEIQAGWLFSVVYAVSQQAAAHGGFRDLIDELGVLSMEINAPSELRSWANTEGRIGLLLGIGSSELPLEWELPAGSVKVVTAKLLHPDELAYAIENDEAGREELCRRFAAEGSHHVSSFGRPPVV
jgi:hypothetical protein